MKKIEDLHILVVGDIMLDKYVVGQVSRISNEAPVPIVNVTNEFSTLGGCGNVVRNIVELGANVACLASVGCDTDGSYILKLLADLEVDSHIVIASDKTTVKERIIADKRRVQMLRLDRETTTISNYECVWNQLERIYLPYDIVVVSDYAKGMITKKLMDFLTMTDLPIIIDPKPQNRNMYKHPLLMTPNEKELIQMGGAEELISRSGTKYILETKGQKGMALYDVDFVKNIEAVPVNVYNVSGAGDTVIAVMAVCLSLNYSMEISAIIANKCAGYVVTQLETSVVPKDIFMKHMVKFKPE